MFHFTRFTVAHAYNSRFSLTRFDLIKRANHLKPIPQRAQNLNVKSTAQKFKETAKSASYLGVVIIGVGVTGALFYTIFKELFSNNSPYGLYSTAVERCINDPSVQDKLGMPIKAYADATRKGRRRHLSYKTFLWNGKECIRLVFYLKGSFYQATVHMEAAKDFSSNSDYKYRYLIINVDDAARSMLVLEDNRYVRSPTPQDVDIGDM